jgi:hypothetical protein
MKTTVTPDSEIREAIEVVLKSMHWMWEYYESLIQQGVSTDELRRQNLNTMIGNAAEYWFIGGEGYRHGKFRKRSPFAVSEVLRIVHTLLGEKIRVAVGGMSDEELGQLDPHHRFMSSEISYLLYIRSYLLKL